MEYLNTIDTTYRAELERLNDVNWSRVESRIAQAEARLEQRYVQLEDRFDKRLAELKAELLKWMFLFWLGTIGTVIALQSLLATGERDGGSARVPRVGSRSMEPYLVQKAMTPHCEPVRLNSGGMPLEPL